MEVNRLDLRADHPQAPHSQVAGQVLRRSERHSNLLSSNARSQPTS